MRDQGRHAPWYTFTHVLHGVLFYAALALVARRVPLRLLIAVFIEGTWEVLGMLIHPAEAIRL